MSTSLCRASSDAARPKWPELVKSLIVERPGQSTAIKGGTCASALGCRKGPFSTRRIEPGCMWKKFREASQCKLNPK